MAGVNQCVFIGNAGRDPETRTTGGGKQVCNFSLAVNERKDGDTLWINVACFDKLAGVVQQYVTKGKQVFVSGRLQVRKYNAKDGTEKQSVELVASTVQFLGGKGEKSSAPPADDFGSAESPTPGAGSDDVPF